MRGKLRDKRPDSKRDNFKRELLDRRRPNKRENRVTAWLNQQLDQEEDYQQEDKELVEPTRK